MKAEKDTTSIISSQKTSKKRVMKKIWRSCKIGDAESVTGFLNNLADDMVSPMNIILGADAFGDRVYYYHNKIVKYSRYPSDDERRYG